MDNKKMKKILEKHNLWLRGEGGGKANLKGADLRGANLHRANLRGADLREADLREADLRGANLRGANLREANLRWANLYGADIREAELRVADLYGANLFGADIRKTDLCGADLYEVNLEGTNLEGVDIDYSCWPLWCGSLKAKADSKIVIQLLYHTLRLAENSDIDEALKDALFSDKLIEQANRFHRVEWCGKVERKRKP